MFQLVVRLSLCSHPVWPCAVLTSDAPTCSDEVAWQQDCKSPKCNCYMFETRIFQSFIKVGVTVTDNWLRLYFHQLYSCLWCGDPIKYPGSVFFPFHNQQSSQFCKKNVNLQHWHRCWREKSKVPFICKARRLTQSYCVGEGATAQQRRNNLWKGKLPLAHRAI